LALVVIQVSLANAGAAETKTARADTAAAWMNLFFMFPPMDD
jgi:hypothetical protein